MGENTFNRRECVRALLKLGFVLNNKRSGGHDKFKAPFSKARPPFIMIPRHNDIHCQDKIVKELERLGGIELVEKFKQYL